MPAAPSTARRSTALLVVGVLLGAALTLLPSAGAGRGRHQPRHPVRCLPGLADRTARCGVRRGRLRPARHPAPAPGRRFDRTTDAASAYAAHLRDGQDRVLSRIGEPEVLYRYTTVLDGFAARLTPDQVKVLAASRGGGRRAQQRPAPRRLAGAPDRSGGGRRRRASEDCSTPTGSGRPREVPTGPAAARSSGSSTQGSGPRTRASQACRSTCGPAPRLPRLLRARGALVLATATTRSSVRTLVREGFVPDRWPPRSTSRPATLPGTGRTPLRWQPGADVPVRVDGQASAAVGHGPGGADRRLQGVLDGPGPRPRRLHDRGHRRRRRRRGGRRRRRAELRGVRRCGPS